MESWQHFLKESLDSYNNEGNITLYHYSLENEEYLTLDPQKFITATSHYSKNEKEVSDVPRSFFYTNLDKTEKMITSTRKNLYSVNVSISDIYDLSKDPEGFVNQVSHPVFGLRKGIEWNDLLNLVKSKYKGAFYSVGGIDAVIWFEPIEIKKMELN